MNTIALSATVFLLLTTTATTLQANGPTGNTSSPSSASRPTHHSHPTRPRPTFVGANGIAQNARQAADRVHGTDWMNRGIPGLAQGALEACTFGRYRWNRKNSCQGAADDRGHAIGNRVEEMRRNGQLGGHTVIVGSRNGYTIGGYSMHTDTAVQVRDPRGNVVGTYLIDNYVGRSIRGTTMTPVSSGTVDFDPITGNTTMIRTIGPSAPRRVR